MTHLQLVMDYELYYTSISFLKIFFFRIFQNDFAANFAQQHGLIYTSIDSSWPPLGISEVKKLKSIQKIAVAAEHFEHRPGRDNFKAPFSSKMSLQILKK